MVIIGLSGAGLFTQAGQAAAPEAPTGLHCELNPQPLGVENLRPVFSWIVNDPDPDEVQSAWQIEVRRAVPASGGGDALVWDSGKVESAESSNVRCGAALAPGELYDWRVRTWDRAGNAGAWSAPQRLATALKAQWSARPIWSPAGQFALLRKEFTPENKPIAQALAFVTARGTELTRQYVFKFYVNGELIGVGPTRSFGGKTLYNTFDVTTHLTPGRRAALVAIAGSADDERDLAAQLVIHYADGTRQTVTTDATWKALDADTIYNMDTTPERKYGATGAGPEDIDARQIPAGWQAAGFDDRTWPAASENKPMPPEALSAQPTRNLTLMAIKPERVVRKPNGNLFFDFGREIIGSVRLTAQAPAAGTRLKVRLGEELQGPDEVRYALRAIKAYDETWTLREGAQTVENWGYRGFRYGELVAADDGATSASGAVVSPADLIAEGGIEALVMHYPFDDAAASFDSSSPELNEVWAFCHYSVKATALDVYQDCPTRERLPYEGDAYINQLSHYALDREFALARYSAEYLDERPTWPTEYKPLAVMMAWEDYLATGNTDSLARCYDLLKTKTLENKMNADGLVEKPLERQGDLVDWPESQRDGYDFQPVNTVVNAFNKIALEKLGQIAAALGREDEAQAYRTQAERVAAVIHHACYDPARGAYRDAPGSAHTAAHASFFPLAFGVVPPEETNLVADFVQGKGMACSVYGAQFLLESLYRAGRGEAALRLMTSKDKHSWQHMIHDLQATVVTEAWDPEEKPNMSFAHAWASAPANIIPRWLMGIQPLTPGYGQIAIEPQLGGLARAAITLPTIKGTVRVEILMENDNRNKYLATAMTVTLPANMTARVRVPVGAGEGTVTVDGALRQTKVITKRAGHYLELNALGSGRHTIRAAAR